jgi:membrane protease YdiL (CAAX protease family)
VRGRRAAEYALLFFALVAAYTAAGVPGGPIPPLVVLSAAAAVYLRRRPGFDRRDLWRAGGLRPVLPRILGLWAVVAAATTALVAVADPASLFALPRTEPLLWAAVVVLYPLLSVYPQELLFRAFLLHRYGPVFPGPRRAAAASAAAFGFAHIIFGNVLAVALTVAGGWLFARRYQQTRSLAVVTVEHAAYGLLIFTVGLGRYFYHAA